MRLRAPGMRLTCRIPIFREQPRNLAFPYRRIDWSGMFSVNVPVAADKEGDREPENATIKFAELGAPKRDRIVHMELSIELADWFGPVIHGNSNDLQTTIPVFVLQLNE